MDTKLKAKLAALKAELTIRERTKNESLRGYARVQKMIDELEKKLNERSLKSGAKGLAQSA